MKETKATIGVYVTGFVLSIIVTLCSFGIVFAYMSSRNFLVPQSVVIGVILILALFQLIVQLTYFMHLLGGKAQHWRQVIFLSTISVVAIIIIGSLWIMSNLNYNMTPGQIMKYTNDQSGL